MPDPANTDPDRLSVTVIVPQLGQTAGGMVTLCQIAEHLARRGHTVHVCHVVHGAPDDDLESRTRWFQFQSTNIAQRWIKFRPEMLSTDDFDFGDWESDVVFVGAKRNTFSRYGLPCFLSLGWIEHWSMDALTMPGPVFCPSNWVRDRFLEIGVEPRRIAVVPDGIDHGTFHPRQPIHDRGPVVATQSHTVAAKGMHIALEALEKVRDVHPELEVLLFGPSPEEAPPSWVRNLGFLDHEQLAEDVYSRASIFLCASEQEGLGNVTLEAMACGAAVVTTDTGGSLDLVRHGESGLIVDRSPEALCRGVLDLLDHEDERRAFAERGQQHALTFRWEEVIEIYEAVLLDYVHDPARYAV